MVAPAQVPPQTLQATKTKLAHVLYALEDLRYVWLEVVSARCNCVLEADTSNALS